MQNTKTASHENGWSALNKYKDGIN